MHLTIYLLSSPDYLWSNWHTHLSLEAAGMSCLISFFPLVWTWHQADLMTWRLYAIRDKEQGWGLWYTKALEDLVCKCDQRTIVYVSGNLSSLLLLVHKFTCIPQFWRGQDRGTWSFSHYLFSRSKKYMAGRSIHVPLCSCYWTPTLGEWRNISRCLKWAPSSSWNS